MDNSPRTRARATPARRARRSRPTLTLIRSRDLPDPQAPPPQHARSPGSRAWVMDCVTPVLWPVPAKTGDVLVFNEHGIRRHRTTGPVQDRKVDFEPLLSGLEQLQRMAGAAGPLRFRSQRDVSQLQLFELYVMGRSMGLSPQSLAALSDGPRAS